MVSLLDSVSSKAFMVLFSAVHINDGEICYVRTEKKQKTKKQKSLRDKFKPMTVQRGRAHQIVCFVKSQKSEAGNVWGRIFSQLCHTEMIIVAEVYFKQHKSILIIHVS